MKYKFANGKKGSVKRKLSNDESFGLTTNIFEKQIIDKIMKEQQKLEKSPKRKKIKEKLEQQGLELKYLQTRGLLKDACMSDQLLREQLTTKGTADAETLNNPPKKIKSISRNRKASTDSNNSIQNNGNSCNLSIKPSAIGQRRSSRVTDSINYSDKYRY